MEDNDEGDARWMHSTYFLLIEILPFLKFSFNKGGLLFAGKAGLCGA